MSSLLQIIYSIGFSVTLVGLSLWRIKETWDRAFITGDPAEFDGLMSVRLFLADIFRAVFWPAFLWRPW